ncbi:hypothetical protein OsI_10625 [Oryza sativa Indica Group]|uniref:Uncharacterized protein n=4 Tax=Oryza TaxID=4527 RepID=A0A8J8YGB5_ORYSJ|nr:hypothetical protein LOC_Os03g12830 [Oryza sativa Japonica Group]EAY89134.1 hypothetical protein OsI_10625 [Oryza sativa Indica Group]EAZ26153.1 hypothetical protein OsJ_10019 [Oryza sativa Japonica Group]
MATKQGRINFVDLTVPQPTEQKRERCNAGGIRELLEQMYCVQRRSQRLLQRRQSASGHQHPLTSHHSVGEGLIRNTGDLSAFFRA